MDDAKSALRSWLAIAVSIAALIIASIALFAHRAEPAPAQSDKLKALLKERLDVLTTLNQGAEASFERGLSTQVDVFQVKLALMRSKLDMTPDKSERLKVYDEMLVDLRKIEDMQSARYQAGILTQVDIFKAKADRLETEIARERELASK